MTSRPQQQQSVERKFYVYLLRRLDGTPCYVGKGHGDRWKRHALRAHRHDNKHLGRIILKARSEGHELPCEIVFGHLTEPEAFQFEKMLIAFWGREQRGGLLVNLTDGGDGDTGKIYSAEMRARMSAAAKGRVLTAEHKAKTSATMKGRPGRRHSQEVLDRIKSKLKGRGPSKEHMEMLRCLHTGRSRSQVTRLKMSIAQRQLAARRRAAQECAVEQTG